MLQTAEKAADHIQIQGEDSGETKLLSTFILIEEILWTDVVWESKRLTDFDLKKAKKA